MPKKLTTDIFIERSKSKHGDRWDYSKSEYIRSKSKILIICPLHGEFNQIASDHLSGCGCPKCDKTAKMSTDVFINRSIEIHGGKWDYSKVEYGNNNYEYVTIICPLHGEFNQRPWAHLRGQGCPKCVNNRLLSNDFFIKRSNDIHSGKWDYSITNYTGRKNKVDILCPLHGKWEQIASIHLDGHGCPKCNSSKLELYLSNKLDSMGELYDRNVRFKSCRNKNPLSFDFFLNLRNILIECDGEQHHKPIDYFGGLERYEYQKNNDLIKSNWATNNEISLIRLTNFSEIDEFIMNLKPLDLDFTLFRDLNKFRVKAIKNSDNYLIKTDFNWYNRRDIRISFIEFINSLDIEYSEYVISDIVGYKIKNTILILGDNFRDCEINRKKDWFKLIKDEYEIDGINVININVEDWVYKPIITKSRIRNTLKLNINKIGGRNCQIREINDNKIVYKFLEDNHIQGKINSSIKIGLYYGDELVSLMTFGKLRKNLGNKSKENSYELLRFCNKVDYSVIGSANKLFNYFKNKWEPEYVLSYADRSWTYINSNIYDKIGMNLVSKTAPSYSYLVGDKKWDRFRYRKDILIQFGYASNEWTERSICLSNKIFRIYDAGCLKYEWIYS